MAAIDASRSGEVRAHIALFVNGILVQGTAAELVSMVKVQQARDKADLMTVRILNPVLYEPNRVGSSKLVWTDALAFMPGQVIEIYVAWDREPWELLGAGIITHHMPSFPSDGMPELEIKAYDGTSQLMDGTDEVDASAARIFPKGTLLHDMVRKILSDYGFEVHMPEVIRIAAVATAVIKKEGQSDYKFIRAISALVGYEFFVEWDHALVRWDAYFRPLAIDSSFKQTWTWGPDYEDGVGDGRMFSFTPKLYVKGTASDVRAFYLDRDTKTWEEVIFPEKKSGKKKQFSWMGDNTSVEADLAALSGPQSPAYSGAPVGSVGANEGDRYVAAQALRIKAAGTSIQVLPTSGFADKESALAYARSWWRANQENFIVGTAHFQGSPKLRPGQVHTLKGIGPLGGDWYVVDVTHLILPDRGYTTEAVLRKVIP